MYCNHCGNKVPLDSQFCNRCGSKMQPDISSRRTRPFSPSVIRPARRRMATEDEFPEEPFTNDYDDFEGEYEDFEDESEYVEEKSQTDRDEETIFVIYPAFYEVGTQYFLAILLSIAATASIAYLTTLPFWIPLIFAAALLIKPIYRHIQNKNTVYRLTPTKIEIKSGIFSVKSRNIPLRHIQDVSVSETFKERLIGIGDVVIDSAAVEGKILMRNIRNPRKYADMILDQI